MKRRVKVECLDGAIHHVALDERGRIVAEDHPHLMRSALVAEALGGTVCPCGDLLLQLRRALSTSTRQVPSGFGAAAKRAAKVRENRYQKPPLVEQPLRRRAELRVEALARKALESASYRRSQSIVGGSHTVAVKIGSWPSISGSSDKVWHEKKPWSGTDSRITALVPLSWYKVHTRLGGVVDGMFILAITDDEGDLLHVVAGRQSRGFDVTPHSAIVKRRDGIWHLTWSP